MVKAKKPSKFVRIPSLQISKKSLEGAIYRNLSIDIGEAVVNDLIDNLESSKFYQKILKQCVKEVLTNELIISNRRLEEIIFDAATEFVVRQDLKRKAQI